MKAKDIKDQYSSQISDIISVQRNRSREAIFFMYEDGSTTEHIVGEATHVRISKDEIDRIFNSGNVIGSVHTHPAGFDPSTIDIMTAISTDQDYMAVAVPITYNDGEKDFTVSCVDLSETGFLDERRLFRGMRRSMFSFSRTGHDFRKTANLEFSNADGTRTHTVVKEGIEFPGFERPSVADIQAGRELGVLDGGEMWLD